MDGAVSWFASTRVGLLAAALKDLLLSRQWNKVTRQQKMNLQPVSNLKTVVSVNLSTIEDFLVSQIDTKCQQKQWMGITEHWGQTEGL